MIFVSKMIPKIVVLCLMPFIVIADEVSQQDTTKDFSGYSLIETVPNTKENVELLRYLDANIDEDGMDFWSDPTSVDKPVEILVHPELDEPTKELFHERNMTISVISSNFTEMIEEEKLEGERGSRTNYNEER